MFRDCACSHVSDLQHTPVFLATMGLGINPECSKQGHGTYGTWLPLEGFGEEVPNHFFGGAVLDRHFTRLDAIGNCVAGGSSLLAEPASGSSRVESGKTQDLLSSPPDGPARSEPNR